MHFGVCACSLPRVRLGTQGHQCSGYRPGVNPPSTIPNPIPVDFLIPNPNPVNFAMIPNPIPIPVICPSAIPNPNPIPISSY